MNPPEALTLNWLLPGESENDDLRLPSLGLTCRPEEADEVLRPPLFILEFGLMVEGLLGKLFLEGLSSEVDV